MTSAFYVRAPSVLVDWSCARVPPATDTGGDDAGAPEPDAAPSDGDAGESSADAGSADIVFDGGVAGDADDLDGDLDGGEDDAAAPDAGAGEGDGGIALDAGPVPTRPICADGLPADEVFGPVVSLVVQPRILSAGGSAGLVMPVPARPYVVAAEPALFSLVQAAATESGMVHETVVVTEDASLGFQCTDPHYTSGLDEPAWLDDALAAPGVLYGCASDGSAYYGVGSAHRDAAVIHYGDAGSVYFDELPTTDDYDVTVLSATTVAALQAWMDMNEFAHDAIDDEAFGHYVGEGRWFVAVHVHPPPGPGGMQALAPLVVSWQGNSIPVTHRLQFHPEGAVLTTDAFVLGAEPMDAADDSATALGAARVTVPPALAGFGLTSGWLTHLRIVRDQRDEIEDSEIVPISSALVAPMPRSERTVSVRVPLACCAGGGVASRAAPARSFTYERDYPSSLPPPAIPEAWFHTPEHSTSAAFCSGSYYGSGGYGGCGSSSGSSRSLRGCAAPRRPALGPLVSWTPIALVVLALFLRGRRR